MGFMDIRGSCQRLRGSKDPNHLTDRELRENITQACQGTGPGACAGKAVPMKKPWPLGVSKHRGDGASDRKPKHGGMEPFAGERGL